MEPGRHEGPLRRLEEKTAPLGLVALHQDERPRLRFAQLRLGRRRRGGRNGHVGRHEVGRVDRQRRRARRPRPARATPGPDRTAGALSSLILRVVAPAERQEEGAPQHARPSGHDRAVGRHDRDADDAAGVPAHLPPVGRGEEVGGGRTGSAEFPNRVGGGVVGAASAPVISAKRQKIPRAILRKPARCIGAIFRRRESGVQPKPGLFTSVIWRWCFAPLLKPLSS